MKNRMTFPKTDVVLRTDDEFKSMADESHHHGPTPLSLLPVGLVSQFGFDYMHLVCLGVVRKLLKFWLGGHIRKDPSLASRLCARNVLLLSQNLLKHHNSIPIEFARKPRSVHEVDRWKATEYQQFLLYTGPVFLRDVLSEVVFNHFMLLSVALTLLISPTFCSQYTDYAHSLLCLFVEQAKHLYGEDFVVYNVHGLTHLADDVKQHGSLDQFSAFPFENKLKAFKKLVRKPSCPLTQIIRQLSEECTAFAEGQGIDSKNSIFWRAEHRDGPVPDGYEGAIQFTCLYTDTYRLNVKRSADCCVLVKGVGPVLVVNILSLIGDVYVMYKHFKQLVDLFELPLPSSSLGIYKVSQCSKNVSVCTLDQVESKCVLLPLSTVIDVANEKLIYAVISYSNCSHSGKRALIAIY